MRHGWRVPLWMVVAVLASGAAPSVPAKPHSDQLIVVASAETRGQIGPCSCPQRPLGGFPWRGGLLKDVTKHVPLCLFVELGEVFPRPEEMEDPLLWARTLGRAYGRMGYRLVILGDDDLSLGEDVARTFTEALRETDPEGCVVLQEEGSGGFSLVDIQKEGLRILCVVLWPPIDAEALGLALEKLGPSTDLTLGFLHGSIISARDLEQDLQSLDLLVVGDGAKFDEIQWVGDVPTAGPGIRGRTLSFVRFAKDVNHSWAPAAYKLVHVGGESGTDPVMEELLEPLARAGGLTSIPTQAGLLGK